jgi:DNA repair exonuclease SbcCD ATPase subunit
LNYVPLKDDKAALQETIASLTAREKEFMAFISELELQRDKRIQDDDQNGVDMEATLDLVRKKSKEVERLQTHLMEIETNYGQEILDLENTISVLRTEIAESSRGQNTWEDLLSTERELCSQALKAKDVAEEELQELSAKNRELSMKNKELVQSMQNLQSVLQNFEKCRHILMRIMCLNNIAYDGQPKSPMSNLLCALWKKI